jgi:hypothetical protein
MVLVFLLCVYICFEMTCTFCRWISILVVYTGLSPMASYWTTHVCKVITLHVKDRVCWFGLFWGLAIFHKLPEGQIPSFPTLLYSILWPTYLVYHLPTLVASFIYTREPALGCWLWRPRSSPDNSCCRAPSFWIAGGRKWPLVAAL